jgi:hypothetical protein
VKSLLSDASENFTVNYNNGIFQLIQDNYLLQFDGKNSIAFYNFKQDSLLKHNLIHSSKIYPDYEKKIKAIIQSYQERLTQNQLTIQK